MIFPFVVWTGPLKPAYRIAPTTAANVDYLSVGVYPSSEAEAVRAAIEAAGGRILDESRQPAVYGGEYAIFRVQGAAIEALARMPHVRWVEPVPRMELDGEREAQIVAENLDGAAAPATAPVPGYQSWLTQVGVDGTGVTIAIVDSGVDANANNATAVAHVDLRGRQAAFVDYSERRRCHRHGRSRHARGRDRAGQCGERTDRGRGARAISSGDRAWPLERSTSRRTRFIRSVYPRPTFATLARIRRKTAPTVMNNSWGATNAAATATSPSAARSISPCATRTPATPALESLAVVFSAGNAGGRPQSITTPHESKNAIIVGNSLTSRPGPGLSVR